MGSCTFAGIFRGKNTIENRDGMTIGAEHLGLVRLAPSLSLMWVFGGYIIYRLMPIQGVSQPRRASERRAWVRGWLH